MILTMIHILILTKMMRKKFTIVDGVDQVQSIQPPYFVKIVTPKMQDQDMATATHTAMMKIFITIEKNHYSLPSDNYQTDLHNFFLASS